jgi:hypothetical protein
MAALAVVHLPVVGNEATLTVNAERDLTRWISRYRTGPPLPPLLTLVSQHSLMLI